MNIFSESGKIPDNITYTDRDPHFTGNIFFTNLDKTFINGWHYKDGKIIKSSQGTKNPNQAAQRIELDECTTQEIRWYQRTCYYYTNGTSECTEWTYVGSTFETYCSGGGSGGGGTTPTNQCNYTEEQAQNLLNQITVEHTNNITYSSGSTSDPDAQGIIRKPYLQKWDFAKFNYSIGYHTRYSSFFSGIVYVNNNITNDQWKFETIKYDKTERTEGVPPPCISESMSVSVSPLVISDDKHKSTVILSYANTCNLQCLVNSQLKTISGQLTQTLYASW
jgi:hypothetical protein